MSENSLRAGTDYPSAQLARALTTAASHEDDPTRERAAARVRRWQQVLDGMAGGSLAVGSRTPVKGLPAWVTPEVVRGGFATGTAAASGPLTVDELERAQRLGVRPDRGALFGSWLTDDGLAELGELLDGGRYRIEYAEEAALLVVAWLLRTGDRDGALAVLDEITPFADRLRFVPAASAQPAEDPDVVYRATVGEVRRLVERREPNDRIETMREALTVWNPYADELLAFWSGPAPILARAVELHDRYRELAARHTRCGKHRDPKSNIGVLRSALEKRIAGEELTPREVGLVRSVVDAMLRKRGEPGSAPHTAIRATQARQAALPAHHEIAQAVAARLSELPQDTGIADIDAALRPVAAGPIPEPIARVVSRAAAGTPEQLIERGVIASAEVLARLTPRIAAATAASAYADPALRTLMDATHRAFSNRRSLLLLNLEHQVRITELPWVQALARFRVDTSDTRLHARRTLIRLVGAAIGGFPGTILPNPLIREVLKLSKQAGLEQPWVEELAADIFMGTFSLKFLEAAQLAGKRFGDSLYARYYNIDYSAVAALTANVDTRKLLRRKPKRSDSFDGLCRERAGRSGKWKWSSVAANGVVIEQAQILTTHNLATAVHLGVDLPWDDLARRAFETVLQLAARLHRNPRPLGTIKNLAYAWRQVLVFLSLSASPLPFLGYAEQRLAAKPRHVRERLEPVLEGLATVMQARQLPGDAVRPLLGWTTSKHPLLR